MEIRLPPDQEAHVAALAASLGRSPADLVVEAIAFWEKRQTEYQAAGWRYGPADAAARILELRRGNVLPDGGTLKDLINFGRA